MVGHPFARLVSAYRYNTVAWAGHTAVGRHPFARLVSAYRYNTVAWAGHTAVVRHPFCKAGIRLQVE